MSSRRIRIACMLAAALLVTGCSRKSPTEPTSFALSGRVRLVGALTAASGQYLGTRVVDDASGVPVQLLSGSHVIANAVTSAGGYRFTGIAAGSYVVRASVFGPVTDVTTVLTITTGDLVSADTLVLASAGDLYPTPNPMDDTGQVTFEIADTEYVRLQILDTRDSVVRHITYAEFPAGLHSTYWDGRNDALAFVSPGYYWITFESGADQRAQLLFR